MNDYMSVGDDEDEDPDVENGDDGQEGDEESDG